MRVFYGNKDIRLEGTTFTREIAERGFMFDDKQSGLRMRIGDVAFMCSPRQSPAYLKGIVEGARGMRGFDIRLIRDILAFCKEKGYDEVADHIDEMMGRM